MCGINGILRLEERAAPIDHAELRRVRDHMAQRGPDAVGEWIAPDGVIGLGHRRLAIIDLSPDGHQPMSWADGRYWIVFNGEIYNYRELRVELERAGVTFRSHSDTEVILALYAREGVAMLSRLRGMFAVALWDTVERRLLLARDPYGIKPLYYAVQEGTLRFASQVKALEAGGTLPMEIDPAGVVGFLLWGSVPEPLTLRRAIRALPASHYMLVEQGRVNEPHAYYQFSAARPDGTGSLVETLRDTVRAHLVADVPVAIFLSAGLDSTLIAALARREVVEPPVTFTLRFERFVGTPYDEAPLAAEVARRLGTRHVERTIDRQAMPDLWARVMAAMDQPSIDGFNTYVVSQVAHEAGLKVVLSGLGGDELFGGYPSFHDVPHWVQQARRLGRIPGLSRVWPRVATRLRPGQPKLRGLLRYGDALPGAYYLRRGLFLPEELPALIGVEITRAGLAAYDPIHDTVPGVNEVADDGWQSVHLLESTRYMRQQLLRDSDWASMAHSLELRVPLVDVRLRDQAARLNFEPARSAGKAAVVQQAAPELPPAVWTRPKSGFFIPVLDWLDDRDDKRTDLHWGRDSRKLALRVLKEWDQTLVKG